MKNTSKYPVSGEGWEYSHHLYRTRTHNTTHCSAVSLKDVIPFATAYSSAIEQRYTDQQIELLQKDEGWIVDGTGIPLSPVNNSLVVEVHDGVIGILPCCVAMSVIWEDVIAYRLTTNDRYINGERVVLGKGDWLVKPDLSSQVLKQAIQCFENAGAANSYGYPRNSNIKLGDSVGWLSANVIGTCSSVKSIGRQLTVAQVLNAENAKPNKTSPKAITTEDMINAATKTLVNLGYTWSGGQLWKPPIGEVPDYINDNETEIMLLNSDTKKTELLIKKLSASAQKATESMKKLSDILNTIGNNAEPSKAVNQLSNAECLFGFMGWLTSRQNAVTLSASHDAGIAVKLIEMFAEANGINLDCRDNWQENLSHPKEFEQVGRAIRTKASPEPEWKEGELPPAGIECKCLWDSQSNEYAKIYVIGRDKKGRCVFEYLKTPNGKRVGQVETEGLAMFGGLPNFLPIKSHRDKVIEKTARALQKYDQDVTELCNKSLDRFIPTAEFLYDLGMLKMPEGD